VIADIPENKCGSAVREEAPQIAVRNLTMAYGQKVIQSGLTFDVAKGEIFIIMGGSGCGKSTLLRHLIGLQEPKEGKIIYHGTTNLWDLPDAERERLMQKWGILYQSGDLWSSMTLAENVALPLEMYTSLAPTEIKELVEFKLSLVGLSGYGRYYPSEISGGMKKRAGLARAMALDPEILFFDEPSAGLDPVSARMLDDLIIELKSSLGATIVVVTHELASIFAIGTNTVFLDSESKTMIATGSPMALLNECRNMTVRSFLTRGESGNSPEGSDRQGVYQ
jgi:phospholipid/cholesterol/gamma-HCH transport system ATP-binding protein